MPICHAMSEDLKPLTAALDAVFEAANRISGLRIQEGVASLILDVTGLPAEERASIERRIHAAARRVPGVIDVRLAMTAEKQRRTIVAIGSGKGGVGKSTVSANVAVALARLGKRVGLVDADIYGPSQPRIMGNHGRPELSGKKIVPVATYGVKMLSIGQLIDPGTAVAWRGPMTGSALGNLMDGEWGDTEMLVVDLPPGTGDVQMTLIQKWKPAGAVIVSTPQDLSLIDATRAIDLFRKLGVPVVGLIENMAGYACPSCGEMSDPFGAGGAEAAAKVMEIPFLGRIPLTLAIRRASDEGAPPAAGEGEEAGIFRDIAARLIDQVNRTGG
jgi:ATP-binding protein involved in chromosome partitioning